LNEKQESRKVSFLQLLTKTPQPTCF
jgi:hypothetical protein